MQAGLLVNTDNLELLERLPCRPMPTQLQALFRNAARCSPLAKDAIFDAANHNGAIRRSIVGGAVENCHDLGKLFCSMADTQQMHPQWRNQHRPRAVQVLKELGASDTSRCAPLLRTAKDRRAFQSQFRQDAPQHLTHTKDGVEVGDEVEVCLECAKLSAPARTEDAAAAAQAGHITMLLYKCATPARRSVRSR